MKATLQEDCELVRAHPKDVSWEFEIQLCMIQMQCGDRALTQMKGYLPNSVSPSANTF